MFWVDKKGKSAILKIANDQHKLGIFLVASLDNGADREDLLRDPLGWFKKLILWADMNSG
jgi:hypothetical protein